MSEFPNMKEKKTMGNPHAVMVPFPAQGHVLPMMEFSLLLVKNGVKVTFVNTDFNHQRVLKSLPEGDNIHEMLNMVSISDGLEPWEDRDEASGKLPEAIIRVMPGELEALIERLVGNGGEDENLCVIAEWSMGWVLEIAEKMELKRAAFWPAAAALLALSLSIPKLVDDGIIDNDGRPLKNQMVQLSPTMPFMNPVNFYWTTVLDPHVQKIFFHFMNRSNHSIKLTDWLLCNSSYELEQGTLSAFPCMLPIGPLLAKNRLGKSVGFFWKEDSCCMEWLDKQPSNSVIYVAFGSIAVFDQTQFEELTLGLELTNRPFLWVVRQDMATGSGNAYPEGFEDRVRERGRIVGWSPQQQVLSHPSVTCFISHCGWNSTVEGIGNGVPFLCWPYSADQFFNQTYICDEWKVGLELCKDETGIIRREEIKDKVEQLLTVERFKERAKNLQEKIVYGVRQGNSHQNFHKFVEWIKEH
uniref:UDP-glycosyltransferase n=1 Tax=Scoparia dulcis TaxID=107240 RepID=A0A5H2Q9Y6_SCODU|nr:UDP-glycosyltransferase [Scoparia dulcis]